MDVKRPFERPEAILLQVTSVQRTGRWKSVRRPATYTTFHFNFRRR